MLVQENRRLNLYTAVSLGILILGFQGCSLKPKEENLNTFRTSSSEKVKGFDPIYADDDYSSSEAGKIFEGLLDYHYLKRPYTLQPALAEAMPEVSADGKIYTFKIKKGVLFQDDPCFKDSQGKGRELIAEDFVYSFKRLADPKLVASGWWVLEDRVKGLDEWRTHASQAQSTDYSVAVEGLKALDRYTLRIELKKANHIFLYTLAMPFTWVVPHEAVEFYGKEFLNHPVGTGPFRLESFNGGSRIVYLRNPTFRKEFYPTEGAPGDQEAGLLADAGKQIPFVDRIEVEVNVESQPLWLQFMAGNLDVSGIPKDNYAQAITPTKTLSEELTKKGLQLVKEPGLDVTHETFNMADPILGKNKLLRQAINLAVDVGPMIDLFYNGRALAAQSPIPPGLCRMPAPRSGKARTAPTRSPRAAPGRGRGRARAAQTPAAPPHRSSAADRCRASAGPAARSCSRSSPAPARPQAGGSHPASRREQATTITNRQTSIEDSNPREYCGKYSSAAFIKTSLLSHVPTTMVTKSTQEKIFAHTKKILWTSDSTIFCFEE
jgi:ABC-type transport system substrate-binding protein